MRWAGPETDCSIGAYAPALLWFLVLLWLVLGTSCIPTPGIVKWEICIAYGPQPKVITWRPDGTIVEHVDEDPPDTVKSTMTACRD